MLMSGLANSRHTPIASRLENGLTRQAPGTTSWLHAELDSEQLHAQPRYLPAVPFF
jgi:hypothetical protein